MVILKSVFPLGSRTIAERPFPPENCMGPEATMSVKDLLSSPRLGNQQLPREKAPQSYGKCCYLDLMTHEVFGLGLEPHWHARALLETQ